jgi:hypothetical protein
MNMYIEKKSNCHLASKHLQNYLIKMNSKETMSIPLTQIHDHSLPWHGTYISIKSGGVKLVFFAQKKW